LELLLLLTALFASLTGAPGDRAMGQVQGVAVVRAAQASQAAVQPARRAIPAAAAERRIRPERLAFALPVRAPLADLRRVYERRLE
jgi:hypothetical protein